MFSKATFIALCLFALGCGGTATPAPTPPPTGTSTFALSGHISDINTGGPLPGAVITILDGSNASQTTTSDERGAFRLAGLKVGGFTVRVRHDGYDSVFRGLIFVADMMIAVQMSPAMQTLAGTWAGSLSFSPATGAPQGVAIPQLTMMHSGSVVSSTFLTSGPYQGSFSGSLRDSSSITSTTDVLGTMTLTLDLAGRNPTTCKGSGNFTGTVNWTRMAIATPQIVFDCGTTFTNVTISLVRQQ